MLDIFVPVDDEKRSLLVITKPHKDNIIAENGATLLNRDKCT